MKTHQEQLAFAGEIARLTEEMGKLLPVTDVEGIIKVQEITEQLDELRKNYIGE